MNWIKWYFMKFEMSQEKELYIQMAPSRRTSVVSGRSRFFWWDESFEQGTFQWNLQSRLMIIWMGAWPLSPASHPAVDVRVPAVLSVNCGASWVQIRTTPAYPLIYDHYHVTTARSSCKHTFIPQARMGQDFSFKTTALFLELGVVYRHLFFAALPQISLNIHAVNIASWQPFKTKWHNINTFFFTWWADHLQDEQWRPGTMARWWQECDQQS